MVVSTVSAADPGVPVWNPIRWSVCVFAVAAPLVPEALMTVTVTEDGATGFAAV